MLTYADGSALGRALAASPEAVAWLRWSDEHARDVVTSPLALSELRRTALTMGPVARAKAHVIAEQVTVVRFFDQSLEQAAMASSVLSPFGALHLGIAVAHPEVGAIATYDVVLARVAAIYELDVVTPGRPDGWFDA